MGEAEMEKFTISNKNKRKKKMFFSHPSSFLLLGKLFYEDVMLHIVGTTMINKPQTLKKEGRPLVFDDIIKPMTQLWNQIFQDFL